MNALDALVSLVLTSTLASLLLSAGCATPASRIRKNQNAFDAYPPETQAKIREGKVAVGFTREQVLMALGRPDRAYRREAAGGAEEVWVYREGGGGVGVGAGSLFGGGGALYGGGISLGGRAPIEERARVIFKEGAVTAVETREEGPPGVRAGPLLYFPS